MDHPRFPSGRVRRTSLLASATVAALALGTLVGAAPVASGAPAVAAAPRAATVPTDALILDYDFEAQNVNVPSSSSTAAPRTSMPPRRR